MSLPLQYDEYTASTLPEANSLPDQIIYRTDLKKYQYSDGLVWADLGASASNGGYLGSGNEAAMLAVTGATVGQYFLRTDTIPTAPWYLLDAADPSDIDNWLAPDARTPEVSTVAFSGAGTYIVRRGRCRVLGLFLTTSDTGTVQIMDGLMADYAIDVLASTVTATGANIDVPVTPPGTVQSAALLIVTGANEGFVTLAEDF